MENTTTLVTGGTGTLGKVVVEKLKAAGVPTRVFSRHPGAGVAEGNLITGVGLPPALEGVGTVIHCATGSKDLVQTRNLLSAAKAAGTPHIVYISIVGVDRIPMFYYKAKLEAEKLIADGGIPFTTLRATQFHNLIATVFNAQRFLPAIFAPSGTFQPIEVSEVASRLVELATATPAGRVADMGGPEVRPARELAAAWLRATSRRRPVSPLRFPGAMFRALGAGAACTPEHADGTITFEQFLAGRPARARSAGS